MKANEENLVRRKDDKSTDSGIQKMATDVGFNFLNSVVDREAKQISFTAEYFEKRNYQKSLQLNRAIQR